MTQKPVLQAEEESARVAQVIRSKIRGREGAIFPTKSEALVGGVYSENAQNKAPDLRYTRLHYSRGQERPFNAARRFMLYSCADAPIAKVPLRQPQSRSETQGPQRRHHANGPLVA